MIRKVFGFMLVCGVIAVISIGLFYLLTPAPEVPKYFIYILKAVAIASGALFLGSIAGIGCLLMEGKEWWSRD